MDTRKKAQDELEQLVDRFGLNTVAVMLSQICREKAEHLATNWQDQKAAVAWEKEADRYDAASRKCGVI